MAVPPPNGAADHVVEGRDEGNQREVVEAGHFVRYNGIEIPLPFCAVFYFFGDEQIDHQFDQIDRMDHKGVMAL